MATTFLEETVEVSISREEAPTTSSGVDLRNILIVSDNPRYSDSHRVYSSVSEMKMDGFTSDDFALKFAALYFPNTTIPYDRPKLIVSGGALLTDYHEYVNKISQVLQSTDNFGLIVTDGLYRGLTEEQGANFVINVAQYVETTEKFYAVFLDNRFMPEYKQFIHAASDDVVLTESPEGLLTESSFVKE